VRDKPDYHVEFEEAVAGSSHSASEDIVTVVDGPASRRDTMIIPTRYKTKIGGGFSWPIGAEGLTLALGDVPQAAVMSITFTMPYRRRFQPSKPYTVASIEFRNYRPHISTPRDWAHQGPKWGIWVCPVPKNVRHTINGLLKHALTSEARPWLIVHQKIYEGTISFAIKYDSLSKELLCESHDRAAPDLLRHRSVAPLLPSD
jgi:hypothetical protein